MDTATAKLLVVDDSRLEREMFSSALGEHGFAVDCVADGDAALRSIENQRPDLVLLDLQMPGMDGFQTLERIRGKFNHLQLPVIILTASEDSESIVRALESGANDYVTKAAGNSVMVARVRSQLAIAEAEGVVRQSQSELTATMDAVQDLILVVDKQRQIRRCNLAVSECLGLTFDRILGEPIDRFFPDLRPPDADVGYDEFDYGLDEVEYGVAAYYVDDIHGGAYVLVLRDVTAQRTAEYSLRAAHAGLELRVAERTTDLRKLAAHQEEVRETERQAIARELHDEFGQMLTAIKIDLAWLKKQVASVGIEADETVTNLMMLVDGMVSRVQQIATDLRPSVLDELGVVEAVRWLMTTWEERAGLKASLIVDPPELSTSRHGAITVFRIVQESLTNVVRHANATQVDVTLARLDTDLMITVMDDGVGPDQEPPGFEPGFGIIGMRQRAEAVGGAFSIEAASTGGTVVRVQIPIEYVDAAV